MNSHTSMHLVTVGWNLFHTLDEYRLYHYTPIELLSRSIFFNRKFGITPYKSVVQLSSLKLQKKFFKNDRTYKKYIL